MRFWLMAIRPKTLPASVAPVVLGWALAATVGKTDLGLGLSCLIVALLLQIAANLANDYFDASSGVDSDERLGPVRVTQAGLLRPSQVLAGLIVCLVLAMAAGVYAAYHAGWWLLGLGAICLLGAVTYTAGPFPLARRGLGELAALVFFGPVACTATFTVLHGEVTAVAWAAGLMPGLHAAAIMAVNNLRDRTSDAAAGKTTLAVRLGERHARILAVSLLVLGNLAAAPVARLADRPLAYLALALVPLGLGLHTAILHTPVSRELNSVLARTGQWELASCAVLAALLLF